jgi:hypothetical protein
LRSATLASLSSHPLPTPLPSSQACLRDRYLLDSLYTSLGPSSLVAINPHKFVHANSDSTLANYGQDHRNTEDGRDVLPPHVFALAGNAYFDMRRTGRDQSILMRSVPRIKVDELRAGPREDGQGERGRREWRLPGQSQRPPEWNELELTVVSCFGSR